jgi:DNA-binding MarR family transcriptional regulator
MANKRRITIELTEKDQEHIKAIQRETGDTTIIAAIRVALRVLARDINHSLHYSGEREQQVS